MDLNSLPRELAERLHNVSIRCSHNNTESEWAFDCIKCTEAVIREAIDKTLEGVKKVICYGCEKEIPLDPSGTAILMHVDPHSGGMMVCQASAIRSLKQSNSGMEVRK